MPFGTRSEVPSARAMSELAVKGKGKCKPNGKNTDVLIKLFEATAALEGCWMGDGEPPLAEQALLADRALSAVEKTAEFLRARAIQDLEEKRAITGSLSPDDEAMLKKIINRTDEFAVPTSSSDGRR